MRLPRAVCGGNGTSYQPRQSRDSGLDGDLRRYCSSTLRWCAQPTSWHVSRKVRGADCQAAFPRVLAPSQRVVAQATRMRARSVHVVDLFNVTRCVACHQPPPFSISRVAPGTPAFRVSKIPFIRRAAASFDGTHYGRAGRPPPLRLSKDSLNQANCTD